MAKTETTVTDPTSPDTLTLKDPIVATILAWLVPGLGHWYQGRRHKAIIYGVCILTTYFYGLYLGGGRVVYASWRPGDQRLFYLCQVATGLPALPALVQARRFSDENLRRAAERRMDDGQESFFDWFMVPPRVNAEQRNDDRHDELDLLHRHLHRYFELGTIYTAIAGLLNVLAIYDAWGGPAYGIRMFRPVKPPDGSGKPAA